MKPVVYGIPNCDQIKRTLAWFAEHRVPADLHDYRKSGAPQGLLREWVARCDWETLVNSVIRRPVVDYNGRLLVGFDPALFATTFLR